MMDFLKEIADFFKTGAKDEDGNGIPDNLEAFGQIFGIIVIVVVIGALFDRLKNFLDNVLIGGRSIGGFFDYFAATYLPILKLMSVALSIALIVFIVYVVREINKVMATERSKFGKAIEVSGAGAEEHVNERWQKVLKLINSEGAADWKFAILEADIMLDELLDALGYRGDSMGEKLKQIEKADFTTLDKAWEAHKIRNSIAHEGSDFLITHREAQRVIRLYEDVFLEFKFI